MKKIFGLVASLTIIAGLCAAVLSYVNSLTAAPIAASAAAKKLDAAKSVMPTSVKEILPVMWEGDDKKEPVAFVGKDSAGAVAAYALIGKDAGGYGGDIVLMVGFLADKSTIVCYKKLQASETPGLGTKLESPEFSGQFKNRPVAEARLKKDGGSIDAITAATITSRAVCRAIADAESKLSKLSY